MKFSQMKVRTKLLLMLMAPMLGLLYFAQVDLSSNYSRNSSLIKLEELANMGTKISALVHEIQKERGMTAGFLGSKGKKFITKLPEQRLKVDKKLVVLKSTLEEFDEQSYGSAFTMQLSKGMQLLNQLKEKRQGVLALSLSAKEAIGFYTSINTNMLGVIELLPSLSDDGAISTQATAYISFLLGKERAGIERAVLTNTFGANQFAEGLFKKFLQLVTEQNTYMKLFLSFASPEMKSAYQQKMSKPQVAEVEQMRAVAMSSTKRTALVNELNRMMGYGGIIHRFKNYVLRGKEKDLVSFEDSAQAAKKVLAQYQQLPGITNKVKQDIEAVGAVIDAYQQAAKNISEMKKSNITINEIDAKIKINDAPALRAVKRLGKGNFGVDPEHWFKTITGKINLLKAQENELSEELLKSAAVLREKSTWSLYVSSIVTLLAFFIALSMGWWTIRSLMSALGGEPDELRDVAKTIAAGDLTLKLDNTSNPDALYGAMCDMQGKLSDIVGQVKSSATYIAQGSSELSNSVQDLSSGAAEQAASVEETSSALEEMSANVNQNADNAKQTEKMAEKSSKQAAEGGKAVEETLMAMKDIADKIGIIEDIAYETKILALNAAIEAARAGEHGKGFAVVAAEVRKLAGNSETAANEISELAKSSVSVSENAGKLLNEMVPTISKTADLVQEITAASEEQSVGINEINGAMTQLDTVTQNNAALSEELASTAEEMNSQAISLQDMMDFFTISNSEKNI